MTKRSGAPPRAAAVFAVLSWLPALSAAGEPDRCGEAIALKTHDGATTRYALLRPAKAAAQGGPIALVLLAGGAGHLDLDERACPRALRGNSLVRSLPLFHEAGFVTALVDAPSSHTGDEGLGAYRVSPQHADDLGRVIADVRGRTQASVWVVGTSRGAISAVNAASRLAGAARPDGVVLTSPLMVGSPHGRAPWMAHSVFSLPLEAIRQPVLVVAHAADKCFRSPPDLIGRIIEKTNGVREQAVVVTGGPGAPAAPHIGVCEGRAPHGFLDQEAEVADGIARFVRGGTY